MPAFRRRSLPPVFPRGEGTAARRLPRISPNFQSERCEKDLKDNKHNSLNLGRKYVRIFVLGHYLFLVAHSFPRASLSENCSLLGTDNVRGQISRHIFAPNGCYRLYIGKDSSSRQHLFNSKLNPDFAFIFVVNLKVFSIISTVANM